jgi:hypothetical protein
MTYSAALTCAVERMSLVPLSFCVVRNDTGNSEVLIGTPVLTRHAKWENHSIFFSGEQHIFETE